MSNLNYAGGRRDGVASANSRMIVCCRVDKQKIDLSRATSCRRLTCHKRAHLLQLLFEVLQAMILQLHEVMWVGVGPRRKGQVALLAQQLPEVGDALVIALVGVCPDLSDALPSLAGGDAEGGLHMALNSSLDCSLCADLHGNTRL